MGLSRKWAGPILIFLLAAFVLILRYRALPGGCFSTTASPNEIQRIAQSIASTGQFANPYPYATGPTAHHAPVFPFLLSFVYRLPEASWVSARVGVNIFFSAILCMLVCFAGPALGIGAIPGFAAALVLAILPPSLAVELCNDQEATLVGVLTVAVVVATAAWLRRSGVGTTSLGLLWGFALLAAPNLALVYAGCLLLGATVPDLRRKIPLLILLPAIVLAPWMIRNRLELGHWFFIRDNFGLELRVSNADDAVADPSLNAERGAMQDYHPLFNPAAAERVRKEGEVALYNRYTHDAIRWIIAHPRRFIDLTAEHFKLFWWSVGGSRRQLVGRTAALLLAAVGLVWLWQQERLSALLLINLFVLYPLVYYLLQSYGRYRFPIEWAVIVLAVYALQRLWGVFRIRWVHGAPGS